jgi:hypothetical protein
MRAKFAAAPECKLSKIQARAYFLSSVFLLHRDQLPPPHPDTLMAGTCERINETWCAIKVLKFLQRAKRLSASQEGSTQQHYNTKDTGILRRCPNKEQYALVTFHMTTPTAFAGMRSRI